MKYTKFSCFKMFFHVENCSFYSCNQYPIIRKLVYFMIFVIWRQALQPLQNSKVFQTDTLQQLLLLSQYNMSLKKAYNFRYFKNFFYKY